MAKNKKPTMEEQVVGLKKFELFYDFAKTVVDAFKWVGTAWIIYLIFNKIAGKNTQADINLRAIFDECSSDGYAFGIIFFALFIAYLAIAYGRRESKLRKDTVEKLQNRIKELEVQLDPGRSSSMLTERGDTNEGDKG